MPIGRKVALARSLAGVEMKLDSNFWRKMKMRNLLPSKAHFEQYHALAKNENKVGFKRHLLLPQGAFFSSQKKA